jgi:ABC-type enterobactin transport system permease subunit
MLTTILAYVIAAVGLATILAGGWSFVMLAIQDERDRPFRHYAVAIAMLAGGFAMVGPCAGFALVTPNICKGLVGGR